METSRPIMPSSASSPAAPRSRRGGGRLLVLFLFVVVLGVLWWSLQWLGAPKLDPDTYQAVFLSNNQVYFGKLTGLNQQPYATLRDIFYLQVSQPLQPSQPGGAVNLVKLGKELHGPMDVMYINREHILFVEDLGPTSQVVIAINDYKKNQNAQ